LILERPSDTIQEGIARHRLSVREGGFTRDLRNAQKPLFGSKSGNNSATSRIQSRAKGRAGAMGFRAS
jgi:hypothetical protein